MTQSIFYIEHFLQGYFEASTVKLAKGKLIRKLGQKIARDLERLHNKKKINYTWPPAASVSLDFLFFFSPLLMAKKQELARRERKEQPEEEREAFLAQ